MKRCRVKKRRDERIIESRRQMKLQRKCKVIEIADVNRIRLQWQTNLGK